MRFKVVAQDSMNDSKRYIPTAIARLGTKLSTCEPQWHWIFPMYLVLGLANVRAKLLATPYLMDGTLVPGHENLVNGISVAPQQYRLLQYHVPEIIHRLLGIDLPWAYLIQRSVWTVLAFIVFHLYLKKWLDTKAAMVGTLFLAATMPLTYFNHLQESEPLNIFLFFIGLWAIREDAFRKLLVILIIGSFNKVTVIFLPVIYFFCWYKRIPTSRLLLRTLTLLIPVILICGAIRLYFYPITYCTDFIQLRYNASGILKFKGWEHFGILFMYGVFWIAAFKSFREKPLFLRRASLIVPLYCLGHFLISRISETRLFLPLAPIIIPMGLFYIFKKDSQPTVPQE